MRRRKEKEGKNGEPLKQKSTEQRKNITCKRKHPKMLRLDSLWMLQTTHHILLARATPYWVLQYQARSVLDRFPDLVTEGQPEEREKAN